MKKIDHAYENFDPQKFLKTLKKFDSEMQRDLINNCIIPSINNYNDVNDENGFFSIYLKDLVCSGEFFKKIKKHFEILYIFENQIYKDGYWNYAYVLLFKKEKICMLFNFEFERNSNDVAYLIDQFSYKEKDKLNIKNIKKKLNEHTKKIWDNIYPEENWEDTYQKFDSPEYSQVSSLNYGKKFYKEFHPEALELEHVEIN